MSRSPCPPLSFKDVLVTRLGGRGGPFELDIFVRRGAVNHGYDNTDLPRLPKAGTEGSSMSPVATSALGSADPSGIGDFVELLERGEQVLEDHTADAVTGLCIACRTSAPCETSTEVFAQMKPFIELYEQIVAAEQKRQGRRWGEAAQSIETDRDQR